MDPQPPKLGASTTEFNAPNESDIFTTLHHLVSRIDSQDRMQEVVNKAERLQLEDTQLLVDCLSIALDRNAAPLKNRLYVWRSLIKVASSAKVFAQNHTLRAERLISDDLSPGVYRISGEPSMRVKVLKQAQNKPHAPYTEPHISWAHLFHPNVIPLYAILLEGSEYPCLVSPYVTDKCVCDYTREHPKIPRMPLISDIANGLFYIHQFDIAHGGLYPQSVLISDDGRAFITDFNTTPDLRDSESIPIRYSAPEILEDDEILPTKAADMWSFACLCYEVLSGKIPFYQISQERKLLLAVTKGVKPIQPERSGPEGNEIDDTIWQLLLICWEREPLDRPSCLKVHQILLGMGIRDDRLTVRPMTGPDAMRSSTVDFSRARANLTGVLGSDHASSLRVPDHIRESLFRFIPDTTKWEATAAAAKKLGPDDTQCLVDFLDLVLDDIPDWGTLNHDATGTLLSTIMMSTYIIPHRYILNGVQYDSLVPTAEGSFGKAYKGRGLNIRVSVVTNLSILRALLKQMPNWFRSSHPNLIPFCGVFYEGINESVRLCIVTPLWTNGDLRNYAPSLPQKSRILLINDVIDGIKYIDELGFASGPRPITPESFLISNEGHAILAFFATGRMFREWGVAPSTYELRFTAPNVGHYFPDVIWSFGCLCYEVLSRKPPYYQYTVAAQVQTAVSQGELLRRPDLTENIADEISDEAWDLIMMCCRENRWDRPSSSEVQESVAKMMVADDRPKAEYPPENDFLALRSRSDVNFPRVEALLDKVQVELLRDPLSKLVQSRIKDVAAAAASFETADTRTLVDFLDLALKDHLSVSEERNRVLALLSRVTSSTRIFPQRYEVTGIKYLPTPIAEGGFGTVHQGSESNLCVKVMARIDPRVLTEWIKELILWAHSSHPNVLPFHGVFLESVGDSQRICLVSPYMRNGNLHDFAPRFAQKNRLPLILDVINGLQYIHVLGIVHSDLKGQNVLISNEGRGLITDFGASHIVTATAAATGSTVYSTLRFSAPEVVLAGMHWQPTKESDIWSFGCLCYQVLSRRVPYHEYKLDIQVPAVLARKEPPRRPGFTGHDDNKTNEDEWDDDYFDEDWDAIDDPSWNLITKCCAPEPEDRPQILAIQELIADMKVWDERPAIRAVPGADIFKLRLNPEIDLNRAGDLLERLQKEVAPPEWNPERNFVQLFNELV